MSSLMNIIIYRRAFSLPNVNLQKGNDIINLESASFSNGHINGGPDYDIINLNPSKDYSSDITLNDGYGGFIGSVNSSFSNIEEINTGIGYDKLTLNSDNNTVNIYGYNSGTAEL